MDVQLMVFTRDEREEIKTLEHLCKRKLGSTIEKWLLNLCKCKLFEVVVQDPKMQKVS
jgi:hypothetical protein